MKQQARMFRVFDTLGFVFIIGAIFFGLLLGNYQVYLDIAAAFLFFGILLSIPSALFFVRKKDSGKSKYGGYWFVKFLTFPLMAVVIIIYFIIRLLQ